jgi:hypothetical protein
MLVPLKLMDGFDEAIAALEKMMIKPEKIDLQ